MIAANDNRAENHQQDRSQDPRQRHQRNEAEDDENPADEPAFVG